MYVYFSREVHPTLFDLWLPCTAERELVLICETQGHSGRRTKLNSSVMENLVCCHFDRSMSHSRRSATCAISP